MEHNEFIYIYNGAEYTLGELSRMTNLHRDTIRRRLELGLTIEEALELPAGAQLPHLSKDDIGKKVPIVFRHLVPVYDFMQPKIGKKYMATICGSTKKSTLCKIFYVIELESGKKLVTYPGEFEFIEE